MSFAVEVTKKISFALVLGDDDELEFYVVKMEVEILFMQTIKAIR